MSALVCSRFTVQELRAAPDLHVLSCLQLVYSAGVESCSRSTCPLLSAAGLQCRNRELLQLYLSFPVCSRFTVQELRAAPDLHVRSCLQLVYSAGVESCSKYTCPLCLQLVYSAGIESCSSSTCPFLSAAGLQCRSRELLQIYMSALVCSWFTVQKQRAALALLVLSCLQLVYSAGIESCSSSTCPFLSAAGLQCRSRELLQIYMSALVCSWFTVQKQRAALALLVLSCLQLVYSAGVESCSIYTCPLLSAAGLQCRSRELLHIYMSALVCSWFTLQEQRAALALLVLSCLQLVYSAGVESCSSSTCPLSRESVQNLVGKPGDQLGKQFPSGIRIREVDLKGELSQQSRLFLKGESFTIMENEKFSSYFLHYCITI